MLSKVLHQTQPVEKIDQDFLNRVLLALIKIHQSKGTHPTQTDIEDLERLTHENNEILGGNNKVPYVRSKETLSIFNNDDLEFYLHFFPNDTGAHEEAKHRGIEVEEPNTPRNGGIKSSDLILQIIRLADNKDDLQALLAENNKRLKADRESHRTRGHKIWDHFTDVQLLQYTNILTANKALEDIGAKKELLRRNELLNSASSTSSEKENDEAKILPRTDSETDVMAKFGAVLTIPTITRDSSTDSTTSLTPNSSERRVAENKSKTSELSRQLSQDHYRTCAYFKPAICGAAVIVLGVVIKLMMNYFQQNDITQSIKPSL